MLENRADTVHRVADCEHRLATQYERQPDRVRTVKKTGVEEATLRRRTSSSNVGAKK